MALLKSQGRGHGVVEVEGAGSLSVGQRPIGEVWSTAERTTPLRLRPNRDTTRPKRTPKGSYPL